MRPGAVDQGDADAAELLKRSDSCRRDEIVRPPTVFTVAIAVFALSFIVAGRLQDKLGPLRVSLTGSVLLTLGFLLCSQTTSLTYLIICFGVLVGVGNGFGYSTPIPVMAKWFPDKRGLAVGLAVAGYGGG